MGALFHNKRFIYPLYVLLMYIISWSFISCRPEIQQVDKNFDFRMNHVTWVFDSISTEINPNGVTNLGGIYYNGLSGLFIEELEDSAKGIFTSGSTWQCKKILVLPGSSNKINSLDGERRIAGKTHIDLTQCLSFNTHVPGVCSIIFRNRSRGRSNGQGRVYLYSQEKGFNAKWDATCVSSVVSDYVQELSLKSQSVGTFWISSTIPIEIYAVRFEPNADVMIPLIKERQLPYNMVLNPNGNIFVDYGRDAFGQLEITLKGEHDTDTVVVHLGEANKGFKVDKFPQGSVRYKRICIPLSKGQRTYTIKPDWEVYDNGLNSLYMPSEVGEVVPFRYCEIEGYRNKLLREDVVRLAVFHQFDDNASYFHCDDETLNKVWKFCKYSIKATSFMGYYIDGDRERRPYEADALINQLGHYGVDSEYKMAQRTIEYLLRNPTWPTEWIMQTILMVWNDYLYSGNTEIMKKYIKKLEAHSLMSFVDKKTKLVTTSLYEQTEKQLLELNLREKLRDLVDYPHRNEEQEGEDDCYDYTDFNTVVNAYHYFACKRLSQIYGVLSMTEKKKWMENYCKEFRTLFNNSFFDVKKGIYKDGLDSDHYSLHANMFAMCFGLVPEDHVRSVLNYMVSKGMVCSVYGSQFLLDALYDYRCDDIALQLMCSSNRRSWMNMIREGSTISTEAWGMEFKPNQDWNHVWGSVPANIIPFRLLGVRPIEGGYKRAEIKPQIATLKRVRGKIPTPYGGIELSVNNASKCYEMSVCIPDDILCDIYVPKKGKGAFELFLDNRCVSQYKERNGYIVLPYPLSGKHEIKLLEKSVN